jgi:hypothetical protein
MRIRIGWYVVGCAVFLGVASPAVEAQRLPCARTNVPTVNARAEARGRYTVSGEVQIEGATDSTEHMCRKTWIAVTPIREGAAVESETRAYTGAFATRAPRIRFNLRGLDAGAYRVQVLVDRGNERTSAGDFAGYYSEGATGAVLDAAAATPVVLEGRRRRVRVQLRIAQVQPTTARFPEFGLSWSFDEAPRATTDTRDRITVALPACDIELRRRPAPAPASEMAETEQRLGATEGFVRFLHRERGAGGYSLGIETRTSDGSRVDLTEEVLVRRSGVYVLRLTDRGGTIRACPNAPRDEDFSR